MSSTLFSIFPNDPFVDLRLYQYGRNHCDPSHSYRPCSRNHYRFHYIISGMGVLESTDSSGVTHCYPLKSGQGFLICPKQINRYHADILSPWDYAWVEFDGHCVKEALELAGLSFHSPIYCPKVIDLGLELGKEIIYIADHPNESPFHLIGHLYLFWDYLTRSSASKKTSTERKVRNSYVEDALRFMEQNFQNNITVQDIANYCNLDRSYFCNIFHNSVAKSPKEFLMDFRMTRAAELLTQTNLSIHDIGNAVGYSNQLHFSRAFKNIYMVSPRQWRQENKNQ